MLKKNKAYVILTVFLFSAMFPFFITFAVAQEDDEGLSTRVLKWERITIDNTWLAASIQNDGLGAQIGDTFKVSPGGIKLLNFKTIGEGYDKDDPDQYFIWYRGTYEFSVYPYTTAQIKDVYPDADLAHNEKVRYLHINKFKVEEWTSDSPCGSEGLTGLTEIKADVVYGDIVLGSLNPQEFNGELPIFLESAPPFKNLTGQYHLGEGLIIEDPTLAASIVRAQLNATKSTPIGEYDIDYANEETQEGKVVCYNPSSGSYSLGSGDKKSRIEDIIDKNSPGYKGGNYFMTTAIDGSKTGQWVTDGGVVGTIYNNGERGDTMLLNSPVIVKPEVEIEKQTLKYNYLKAWWDYEDIWPSVADAGVCDSRERTTTRETGIKVTNYGVKQTYVVDIDYIFEAELIIEDELGGADMDDPSFSMGDMVMDASYTGDSEVKIWTQEYGWIGDWWGDFWQNIGDWWEDVAKWWEDYWWVFVLILCIVLAIVAVVIIIKVFPAWAFSRKAKKAAQTININLSRDKT